MHKNIISTSSTITRAVLEILLEKIKAMGWDPSQFGMHSLTAGGAITVANADMLRTQSKSVSGGV